MLLVPGLMASNNTKTPMLLLRSPASSVRCRHALIVTLVSLSVTGCARTPAPTVQPPIAATGSHGDSRYASAPAHGLMPARVPLMNALDAHYEEWAGVPYRYGGNSKSGIDCSAFVRRTIAAVRDLRLPRTTWGQAQRGYAIERSELRVGDLVFFRTGPSKRHVGIYIGNGRFMHASSSRGVTISSLNNIYWRNHYWQARRLTGG